MKTKIPNSKTSLLHLESIHPSGFTTSLFFGFWVVSDVLREKWRSLSPRDGMLINSNDRCGDMNKP